MATTTGGAGSTTPLVAEDSVPFVTSLKPPPQLGSAGQTLTPGKVLEVVKKCDCISEKEFKTYRNKTDTGSRVCGDRVSMDK